MRLLEFSILFLILFLGFIIRSYLMMKYKWVGKDAFYHLIVAQEIKTNKKIPTTINNFIYPETYEYPPLLHIFLSLFDNKFHSALQYLGVIADLLTGIIIFIFCNQFFGFDVAILACAFYLFTPMSIDGSFSLSPRSIANFFMATSLLSFAYYFETGLIIGIPISIMFSLFVLLTHRLTTQSLIFSMFALSFATQSIIPIFIVVASLILAIVFSKGFYLKVLNGHISFLKIFAIKVLNKESRGEMTNIFPSPIYLLFNVPIFVLFLVSLSLQETPIVKFLFVVGLSLLILSFAWIFGEGVRHMSNAIFVFAILSAIYTIKLGNTGIIILFLLVSIIFSVYKLLRMEKMLELGNITTTEMIAGFNHIKNHKEKDDLLLCLPLDITYNAAYFTGCTMLQSSGGFAKGLNFNQKLNCLLKENLYELIDEYAVNWVFSIGPNMDIPGGRIVFQSKDVTVIRMD